MSEIRLAEPAIIVYPHDIRQGSGNRIITLFPRSLAKMPLEEFDLKFAMLQKHYGERLLFQREQLSKKPEAFPTAVLEVIVFSPLGAKTAAKTLGWHIQKAFLFPSMLHRATDNREVLRTASSFH